jgi:hypothetical protein
MYDEVRVIVTYTYYCNKKNWLRVGHDRRCYRSGVVNDWKKKLIINYYYYIRAFSFLFQVGMWMSLDSTNGIMDDGIDVDLWIASSIYNRGGWHVCER